MTTNALVVKSFSDLEKWFRDYRDTYRDTEFQATPHGLAHVYALSVWCNTCIQKRAKAVAGVPVVVKDADDEILDDHPLARVFTDYNSRLLWRIEASLLIWGKAYLEIVFNDTSLLSGMKDWLDDDLLYKPVGVNWLNPLVTRFREVNGEIVAFEHYPPGGAVLFAPEDVVYLHTFNPLDDLDGLSQTASALVSAGVARNVSNFAQVFFINGALLGGVLGVEGATDDQVDRAERKWKRLFRGVRNFFRTFITGGKVTYTPISAPPDDLAMPELTAEARRDICAAYEVPPVIAGAWEVGNYSITETRKEFWTGTILPELDFIEDELNRQLVRPFWPDVHLAFDTSDIEALREDEAARNNAITAAFQGGWMTKNEARSRAGLPEDPEGDTYYSGGGGLFDFAQMPDRGAGEGKEEVEEAEPVAEPDTTKTATFKAADDPQRGEKDDAIEAMQADLLAYFAGLADRVVEEVERAASA